MPNSQPFVQRVNDILQNLESDPSAKNGVELANEILKLVGMLDIKSAEEVFESSLELPNAERYDRWFQPHPIFKSDRACFELAENELLQGKFYWLQKHTRQIIAGGVHFTPNFEDEDFTHNERYKVGIDFFLSPDGKSLQVVLSNRGNLRVVELSKRLNSTQVDIFTKWDGAGSLSTQEALHTTLWESFKLKSVNQKFYDGVANSFNELLQHLKSIDKDEEEAKLFASRLLGRLLFCWFLRKKGIIDESIGYFNAKGMDATLYYKSNLERLFFLTLNTPVDERDELQKQHQQQQLIHLPAEDKQPSLFKTDQKTPYLNGGLFEPHENDWFKDRDLTLPGGYFVNLFNHFEEFNFTTDESSPEYEQIAIDPEMLGRVFESLLATQIDETGQQARKAKGAFYTPREVVSYMCKESLRSYLFNAYPEDERYKKSINDLLDTSDREWAGAGTNSKRDSVPKEYRMKIIDFLDSVTILDPACGSGAFPMGMLQLCLRTYERLEVRFDPYITKLKIIENNIFGIDIEPMAVEISRLRAWLSLVVDEQDGRTIKPLPNLEFKFVCANSLVPLEEIKNDLFNDPELHNKLSDIRKKYFNARKPHRKKEIRDEYYKLTQSNENLFANKRTLQLRSFEPFVNAQPSLFYDTDQMFGLEGFDIIIGNPPYVNVEKIEKQLKPLYQRYITAFQKYDLYVLFIEFGISTLNNGGTLSYITSNKYLSQGYGKKLRELLLKQHIKSIINFNYDIFDSATVRTAILSLSKETTSQDYDIEVININTKNDIARFDDRLYDNINVSIFKNAVENNFRLNLNQDKIELLEKIKQNTYKLSDICSVNYGLRPSSEKLGLKKSSFIYKENSAQKNYKPYFEGKDMGYWKLKNSSFIDYRPDVMYNPMFLSLFENEKLVGLRTLSDINKLRFIYDNDGMFCNDSVVVITLWYLMESEEYVTIRRTINSTKIALSKEYSYDLIQGILNSKLMKFYFNELMYDGTHFYPNHMKQLPIKNVDNSISSEIANVVASILKQDQNSISKSDISHLDRLVYELYDLSPGEITVVEESLSI